MDILMRVAKLEDKIKRYQTIINVFTLAAMASIIYLAFSVLNPDLMENHDVVLTFFFAISFFGYSGSALILKFKVNKLKNDLKYIELKAKCAIFAKTNKVTAL
jgi:hypothetical protein